MKLMNVPTSGRTQRSLNEDNRMSKLRQSCGSLVNSGDLLNRADAVRAKLERLGITESDVADAVNWARRGSESAD